MRKNTKQHNPIHRRDFLATAGAAAAVTGGIGGLTSIAGVNAGPFVHTSKSQADSETLIGSGEYQYRVSHQCVELPSEFHWQITHNVAVDEAGNLYVIHEGNKSLADHPAIFVFDSEGKFLRAFGSQFQGGGHGLEVRKEGNEEFLYVTAYQSLKFFAKLTLTGETVWQKFAPIESDRYATGEAEAPDGSWGRDRFMPTNISFASDGSFYVADGYGAWCVHHYSADGSYMTSFGKAGKDDGEFSLPHGIWTDDRSGTAQLVVADRANDRLQWFSLDGIHQKTMNGFLKPANVDTYDDLMLVPELYASVALLNSKNEIVVRLGDDEPWRQSVLAENNKMRTQPDRWKDGKFIHPHDACFDRDGNIYVAEWVATGRVSRLTRV